MRVCPDFAPVCSQLLLRRAFSLVLAIFTHVTTPLYHVAAKVATIGANLFRVRPNLAVVGSQFSTFPAIDLSLAGDCVCAQGKERGKQQHYSQMCSLHRFSSSQVPCKWCAGHRRLSGSPNAEERKHSPWTRTTCAPSWAQFLFGETLAKNLDAEPVRVDEIFHLSFHIFHLSFHIFHFVIADSMPSEPPPGRKLLSSFKLNGK
jgi:hypothetical protein